VAGDFAIAGERAQTCLLLGIDAHDRVARLEQLLEKMSQMAARLAAMRRVAAGQPLEHLAPGQTEPINLTGSGSTGARAVRFPDGKSFESKTP
jgi:hypothetical protein